MKKGFWVGWFGIMLLVSFFVSEGLAFADEPTGAGVGVQTQEADKKVIAITAEYIKKDNLDKKDDIMVGTTLQLTDFSVTKHFTDGETKGLSPEEITAHCELSETKIPYNAGKLHEILIKYKGGDTEENKVLSTKVVFQVTSLKLKSIKAKWNGKTKYHIGDEIKTNEIEIHGVFDTIDRTGNHVESTQNINVNLVTLEPTTIKIDGDNSIKAQYNGKEVIFVIRGYSAKGLKVEYSGPKTMIVGQSLDRKKIKVSQIFSSGELKKIDDFTIDSEEVKLVGPNIFTITYGSFSERLTITGVSKVPEKLDAKYEGADLVVGSDIDITKMIVTATNNDKTKEPITSGFEINPKKVVKVGVNTITVTYKGLKTTVNIKATEVLPTSIMAIYNGSMVIEGSLIKKNEIAVTAYYPDGTNKSVSDFELSTETVNTIGMQEVVVSYKGMKATVYIPVTAKMVTSIEVSYKGGAITQHSSINRDDIVVTAKYNDGTSANVTDYTMSTTVATQVGRNVFSIYYGGKNKDLIIEALARLIIGRGTLKAEVSGEEYGTGLTAFIENQFVREDIKLEVEAVEKAAIKRAIRRVNKTNRFVAFDLMVDSFDFDENQYMIMEATIPEEFNPAHVGIFYTPDKNKTMVELTGGLVSPELYRFYVYKSGTYVLMEKEEQTIGRQELREEGNRTPFLVASLPRKMQVKEKATIKSFLLFASFENSGFTYESDDEDVLTVSKEGVMEAKRTGTVSVTVSSNVGGYSKTYEVQVAR